MRVRPVSHCLSLLAGCAERNPTFLEDMERAVGGKNKNIIISCAIGGTLETIIVRDHPIKPKVCAPHACRNGLRNP